MWSGAAENPQKSDHTSAKPVSKHCTSSQPLQPSPSTVRAAWSFLPRRLIGVDPGLQGAPPEAWRRCAYDSSGCYSWVPTKNTMGAA